MARRFFFLAIVLAVSFPAHRAFSADGKLTILKKLKKRVKPQRIVFNLTLRHNGANLNLGSAEADQSMIVVAASGEVQVLLIECSGFVRSEKINSLMPTKISFVVPSNDHVVVPNFFNLRSLSMKIEFQDNAGRIYYVGRDLYFNFF